MLTLSSILCIWFNYPLSISKTLLFSYFILTTIIFFLSIRSYFHRTMYNILIIKWQQKLPCASSLTSYRPLFCDTTNILEEWFILSYLFLLPLWDPISLLPYPSTKSALIRVTNDLILTNKFEVIPSLYLIQTLSSDTIDYFLLLEALSSPSFGDIPASSFPSNTDCSFSVSLAVSSSLS